MQDKNFKNKINNNNNLKEFYLRKFKMILKQLNEAVYLKLYSDSYLKVYIHIIPSDAIHTFSSQCACI